MSDIFTQYVRDLQNGSDPSVDVLDALKKGLRRRMRQRGLMELAPRYLGCEDVASWDDAWEDLVQDCYLWAIIGRMKSLKGLMKKGNNIDGAVVQNIGFFLFGRQKKHDPAGYRLFKNITVAICDLREEGQVAVTLLGKKGKILGKTIVREISSVNKELISHVDLREIVMGSISWSKKVTRSLGRIGQNGRDSALGLIRRLLKDGVQAFRVKDLVDVSIEDVRAAHPLRLPTYQQFPVREKARENGGCC